MHVGLHVSVSNAECDLAQFENIRAETVGGAVIGRILRRFRILLLTQRRRKSIGERKPVFCRDVLHEFPVQRAVNQEETLELCRENQQVLLIR